MVNAIKWCCVEEWLFDCHMAKIVICSSNLVALKILIKIDKRIFVVLAGKLTLTKVVRSDIAYNVFNSVAMQQYAIKIRKNR